ncbi:class I SAM-dependent methyltransferase [Thermoflavifilum thermophilum]|uniref:Methyltransferase domain-containing protein n=1 Tax=Thermoflavifilum thermophilum TaxID=1393122 RepID=A0A1I7NFU1_9BACT|nr:class I SAM-dependent methyltransferase [Thermoflavifilum thermophilum]SFV33416.1 Methyltransferase domain-containing protein [Thermoflavifilum thermophilum]
MKHPLPADKRDFDTFARHYRDLHDANIRLSGANSAYFARLKIQILALYESDDGQHVLDLGCGDGLCTAYMQQSFPSWQLTGVDVSAESIAVAQERRLPGVAFIHYDGRHLPFDPAGFDVIFMAGVLHHVGHDQRLAVLQEARRVARPQGRIYIFEHNPFNLLTRYFVSTCAFDRGVKLLMASEAKRLLCEAGWKAESCRYYIFFPRHRIFRPLCKAESRLSWLPLGGQYMIRACAC